MFIFIIFLRCYYRSTPKLSPDELTAQSKTIWPTPTIVFLFSPQFKLITDEYLHQKFEFYGIIARGAFGTVLRVVDRNERKEYALKVLEKSQVSIQKKNIWELKILLTCAVAPRLLGAREF